MKRNRNKSQNKNFGKLAATTIAAVYLLILVGGIVRSSGSGMGCPDWPTCFGQYVPPTSADQLPSDYQEIYKEKRLAKNERFARLLSFFGAEELAYAVQHDDMVGGETDFNPVKTWIEYINRLVGVFIGFLILLTAFKSLAFRKSNLSVTLLSLAALVIVIFQGWLGSIVVSTNLMPWLITVHMLPALLLVGLLIAAYVRVQDWNIIIPKSFSQHKVKVLLISLIVFSVVQIILGTQVREQVDEIAIAHNYAARNSWIDSLGLVFYIHRSYSLLLILLHLVAGWMFYKQLGSKHVLTRLSIFLLCIVLLEVISGIILAYLGIPALFQPIHLLFGTAVFGIQFFLLMLSNRSIVQPKNQTWSFQTC